MIILCSDRSIAIVVAIDTYQQVSSSALCLPGNIHGTFTMKASTISTDRYRFEMIRFTRFRQWFDNLLERAAAEGMNNAAAATMEVKRNADLDRVNDELYSIGSKPHRVCANF